MTKSADNPLPGHDRWLRRIASDRSMDSLSRWQVGRILRSIPPNVPTVAFYCPTKSFRGLFGQLPAELERRGIHVLKLFSERYFDEYENHPNAFREWGDMMKHLGFINVFIVPTIMDCLPDESTKVLLLHTSFGGVPFTRDNQAENPNAAPDVDATLSDEELVEYYTHMSAFWPLYDYYLAATPDICLMFEKNFWTHDQRPLHGHQWHLTEERSAQRVRDALRLQGLLAGKRLAKKKCIIPFGYPSLDEGIKAAAASTKERRNITYAPTPLVGKPHWEPYASARTHGPEIITNLLKAFPDRPVVYKPYADELIEITQPVIEAGSAFPNFIHSQTGGHYQDLYAETAVMISDFSGAAYTFAYGQGQPVVFFSPHENQLPEKVARSEFCQNRQRVGQVATNPGELVQCVTECLTQADEYTRTIQDTRSSILLNAENSAEYLADRFDHILHGFDHSDWFYFGESHSENRPKPLAGRDDAWSERNTISSERSQQALKQACLFIEKQDSTNALSILNSGITQAPDCEAMASTLGRLLMVLKRPEQALEPLFHATEINPWEASHHEQLAEAMRRQNMHQDAQVYLQNSISLRRSHAENHTPQPVVQAA